VKLTMGMIHLPIIFREPWTVEEGCWSFLGLPHCCSFVPCPLLLVCLVLFPLHFASWPCHHHDDLSGSTICCRIAWETYHHDISARSTVALDEGLVLIGACWLWRAYRWAVRRGRARRISYRFCERLLRHQKVFGVDSLMVLPLALRKEVLHLCSAS
jgi:hypothetical protein